MAAVKLARRPSPADLPLEDNDMQIWGYNRASGGGLGAADDFFMPAGVGVGFSTTLAAGEYANPETRVYRNLLLNVATNTRAPGEPFTVTLVVGGADTALSTTVDGGVTGVVPIAGAVTVANTAKVAAKLSRTATAAGSAVLTYLSASVPRG